VFRHIGLTRPTPPQRGKSAVSSGQLRSLGGPRTAISLIPMACIVALVATGGSGCRPGYQNVSPVTGRVTLDGIPLSGAQVMFLPTIGRPSKGETNADGVYELVYTYKQNGAEHGMHTVRVTTALLSQDGTMAPERVPKMYNEESQMQQEVRRGRNTIDLPLVSGGAAKK
jgi:hypothetical protein